MYVVAMRDLVALTISDSLGKSLILKDTIQLTPVTRGTLLNLNQKRNMCYCNKNILIVFR